MKHFTISVLAVSFVTAAPAFESTIEKRQIMGKKTAAKTGGCGPAFIFARGTWEPQPLGIVIGPGFKSALERQFPGLQTFGVPYPAATEGNLQTARTNTKSTNFGVQTFQKAFEVCPQRIIIASGYSQGAAVITTAIAKLPIEIKSRIAGVALWGSTLNKQNKGLIPDFPADRAKTWCNKSDGVCGGQLLINAGHLAYTQSQFKEATTWLAGNVQKLKEISESA